jgi:hypothetical protein
MTLSLLGGPSDLTVVQVLLVEDNDGDARLVELMIQGTFGKDIELSRARSLAEALELLDTATPDCVTNAGPRINTLWGVPRYAGCPLRRGGFVLQQAVL